MFPDLKSGATVYSRQRVRFRGRTSKLLLLLLTPESKKWRADPVTIVPRFDLLRVTGPAATTSALELSRCGVCSTFGEGDDSPADLRALFYTEMRHEN